jgi:hypothetical protein
MSALFIPSFSLCGCLISLDKKRITKAAERDYQCSKQDYHRTLEGLPIGLPIQLSLLVSNHAFLVYFIVVKAVPSLFLVH